MGFLPKAILGSVLLGSSILAGSLTAYAAGTETFYENSSGSPLLPLIQSAKQSIDIEIYEMDDPSVQNALRAAIRRGVHLRVIQESKPVGAGCRVFLPASDSDHPSCRTQKTFYRYVTSHGGTYIPFAYEQLCGVHGKHCFQHGKIVIADSHSVLFSTGNFNVTSLCDQKENPSNCTRDYTIVSTDATVVQAMQTLFEKDLVGQSYDVEAVLSKVGTDRLTVSPDSLKPLVDFIHSAKKTVQIQNQYLKDPSLNAAIVEAANRGVKVYVMVLSPCWFAKPSKNDQAQWKQIYGAFDRAKVHTKIFTRNMKINGHYGYLHAKAILVDGTRAWVGSVNGSTTSLSNNREYGIFFDDPVQVNKFENFLYNDYVSAQSESWKDSLACKNDHY